MRGSPFPLLVVFALAMSWGCTTAPIVTPESITTEAATESPTLQFSLIELPDARSVSITTSADGSLYLIYGQGNNLYVSRSDDGGSTFGEPVLATGELPVHILPIERPAIAGDSDGRVHIAWLEMPPDFHGGKIWYAVSANAGETFEPGQLVATEAEGEVTMVEIAVDEAGNPLLAWLKDSELKFTRSTDGGSTFSDAISIGEGSCECCQPKIVVNGGDVHIAYRSLEPGNEKGDIRDIVMIHSTDAGETFQPVTRVSDEHWYLPACPIAGPSFAARDGGFYVAWMDGRLEPAGAFRRGDIWFASSQDGGKTFSANRRVNADLEMYHTLPSVAVGPGGRIHIAWEVLPQGAGDAAIYYTTSDDGGQSFAAPRVIADSTDSARGAPGKPVLVVDTAGHVTLAWLDRQGARVAAWIDDN